MSVPQVPPRPSRSPHQFQGSGGVEVPRVPPRPNRRGAERSQSPPNHEHFPTSPFNEPPFQKPSIKKPTSGLTMTSLDRETETKLPKRPSSVSLPTLGQEGNEYADMETLAREKAEAENEEAIVESSNEPHQTRNVAGDLPLHAPKPSFSKDTAKQKVAPVTRTDSRQAAAQGIGKPPTPSGSADIAQKRQVSFRPPSSAASTERPSSAVFEEEQGIPEIGQRVPMHPDAGDVQAPGTTPLPQSPAGIGFHNSGYSKPSRNHRRTASGREVHPPGSYGLHGHGAYSVDRFEQQWYEKHPEALEKEEGEYGPSIGTHRGEYSLSSADLNRLVRETAKKNQPAVGPPSEQIGYDASEGYASKVQTPNLTQTQSRSSISMPSASSPLRKSSFPVDPDTHEIRRITTSESTRSIDQALDSETEDDELHIAPPTERRGKYTATEYDAPKINLGPDGGNQAGAGGFIEETGYGVPILASDEVARSPGAEFLQPAVSPTQSRRGSAFYAGHDQDPLGLGLYRGGSAGNSRPTSRPVSVHKLSLYDDERDLHTPLEDVDEYEPLFPDDEGHKKPITAAQRLKMKQKMKRFPSQDIWEDTPNSLQLETTVDTPEPVEAKIESKENGAAAVFETPEQEAERKGEPSEQDKAKLLSAEERLAKSHFKPHIRDELDRPHMSRRFPSKDIWEDSPDHAELTTTVGEDSLGRSPPDEGLVAGAVVQTSGKPKDGLIGAAQTRDGATEGAPAVEKPSIPPRPKGKSQVAPGEPEHSPAIPSRPPKRIYQVPPADAKVPVAPSKLTESVSPTDETAKPQIPARPSRKIQQEPSDPSTLTKVTSASSVGSDGSDRGLPPTVTKAKPPVPARPVGSKIAALQGGFMADLNSRLKGGPPAPKPQEPVPEKEEEKAPLSDARKGRAKGPAKRKPAAVAADAASGVQEAAQWSISQPVSVWQTDASGRVSLSQAARTSHRDETPKSVQLPEKVAPETAVDAPTSDGEESDPPTPSLETKKNPLSIATTPSAEAALANERSPLSRVTTSEAKEVESKDAEAQTGGKAQAEEGEQANEVIRD